MDIPPSYRINHGNIDYNAVMFERLAIMSDLRNKLAKLCKYRTQTLEWLENYDPDRHNYNLFVSSVIYDKLKHIPFRHDTVDMEVLQYPEYTLRYGGDCDDLSLAYSIYLRTAGVVSYWIISKIKHSTQYNHIAVFVPNIGVADLTVPKHMKKFPLPVKIYQDYKLIK